MSDSVQLSAKDSERLAKAVASLDLAVQELRQLARADNPLLAEHGRQLLASGMDLSQRVGLLTAITASA